MRTNATQPPPYLRGLAHQPSSPVFAGNKNRKRGKRTNAGPRFAPRDGVTTIPESISQKIMAGGEPTAAEQLLADEAIGRAKAELKRRYFKLIGLSDVAVAAVADSENDLDGEADE